MTMKKKKLTFEEIYSAYKNIIYMESSRKLNSKELIEDAMQETLLKVYKQYEKISDMDYPAQAVYIGKVARGTAINIFNREVVKKNNIDSIEEYGEDVLVMQDIVLESDIEEYLVQLSEADREIIHMVYYDEFTYFEIANMLCITEDNARQKLCRAKKRLRDIIEKSKGEM